MKLVCATCKGSNIQVLAWIDVNSSEYKSEGPGEWNDRWCSDCNKHVNFINKNEKSNKQPRASR